MREKEENTTREQVEKKTMLLFRTKTKKTDYTRATITGCGGELLTGERTGREKGGPQELVKKAQAAAQATTT